MHTSAIETRLARLEQATVVRPRERIPEEFVRSLEDVPREAMVPPVAWGYGSDGRLSQIPQSLSDERVQEIRGACRQVAERIYQGRLVDVSDIMARLPDEVVNGLCFSQGRQ